MKKKGTPKVEALEVLEKAGTVSTEEYQAALAEAGYPGTRFRAHRLLNRFLSQELAEREGSSKQVTYKLKEKELQRSQPFYLWTITEKGVDRRKWLRKQASRVKQPRSTKKGPKGH